ncbi:MULTISPECIES: hypothetical protein [Chelativorans]|uniref:Uncharacterized protein n=1 Tax=Chelativorans sp. (strain BNC1) TaxID=266779 RepID=Q11H32_CHESB|nr:MULTISPECIES: hypothetical protein [Chelativorans]
MANTAEVYSFPGRGAGNNDSSSTKNPARKKPREWRKHGHYGPDNNGLDDALAQLGAVRQFCREWLELPAREVKMLLFIFGETVLWGKPEKLFTHEFIEKGFDGPKGNRGTGIGRTQSKEILASLEAKGLIAVNRSGLKKGMIIRPNIDWNPPAAPAIPDAPPEGVRIRQRPSDRRSLETSTLERTMRNALMREYTKVPAANMRPWTEHQHSMVAQAIRGHWSGMGVEQCHAFIDWLVERWAGLGEFYTMPQYPDIDFICIHGRVLRLEFENAQK